MELSRGPDTLRFTQKGNPQGERFPPTTGNLKEPHMSRARFLQSASNRIHIAYGRFWRSIGRKVWYASIALLLCLSLGVQQTRADVAFFEWLSDNHVTYSMGMLMRAAIW